MTSVPKNVYINKLDDIVGEYNNTYYRTIKMKLADTKNNTYIDLKKEVNDKDTKFWVGDQVRISRYKNIFAKGYTPDWSVEIIVVSKIKNTVPWTYVINDINGEEVIGTFSEKELQKTNQKEFRIKKVIKTKGDKLYVKWKGYDNLFNSWIDKKNVLCDSIGCNYIKISRCFPKPYKQFGRGIKVKVDLSDYATNADIKNISHVDTSSFALKTNLGSLKTEVDKLGIDKLAPVPVDLSKLSHVVKDDAVKKDVFDKLVTKVNNIDTSGFVSKTSYDTDKSELENKIPDISSLVKKTDYNAKIAEIEGKIPDVIGLATKSVLTTVENKIPDVSNLVKKKNRLWH